MKKTIIFILILIILVLGFLFFTQKKDQENQVIPSQEFEITTNYIDEEDEERIISILYPSVGIEQIDKEIKEYVDSEANTFKEMEYISFSGAKYILDIDYFPVKFNDDIISFKFNKSDYTGGAHGNQYIACFTYNIKENKRLYLNDFFSSETYLDKISEFSINDFMNDEYADEEWIKDGAGPKLENYDKFVITENAFVFYFPPYQVSPYALGERQIVMPLNQLKEILNEEIFENYDFSLNKGIYILSPLPGDTIKLSSIVQGEEKYFLDVEGYLNGNGWAPFEAVGGRVELLDENNNVLTSSNIDIIGNWMKIPVYFRVYLFFDPKESKTGTLLFHNDNASDLEENEREFSLPLKFE
ncbi:MAG: hypothetical protein MCSN_1200 [Candidatus Microsyncoccus archaeolyticus]|nr:MAG: hypothetical protein MCSN_1200 [Candidatus Parcubacteria bacterium]